MIAIEPGEVENSGLRLNILSHLGHGAAQPALLLP